MKAALLAIFIPILCFSQESIDELSFNLWIEFQDKGDYSVNDFSNSDLFSDRAIARREKQNIAIHFTDLPIYPDYISQITDLGFEVLNKSKWFNGITANCKDTSLINELLTFDFIKTVDTLGISLVTSDVRRASKFESINADEYIYGHAENQIEMIGGLALHDLGFQGQGIHIAVLDGGFRKTNELDAFTHLFANNQILGTWDYVDRESSVYEDGAHGMSVLSTMAGFLEDEFLGTAPKASYWLLRTEDGSSETLIEEYNWATAAEFADSVGVDIINSSLGYTTFDIVTQDHTYADLDGQTTVVTKAATLAARKGIIVCNSAGNSGNDNWKYIGAPADADSILSVGAVNPMQEVTSFSSFGPSADGRVKPTVSAQGGSTAIITPSNTIATSNGTSFSSPIIAGMTACLWQAHYDKSNMQIIEAITQSAHLYQNPDNQLGFGIPNYALANALLLNVEDVNVPTLNVYPNPAFSRATFYIYSAMESDISYKIVDLQGKVVRQGEVSWNYSRYAIPLPHLQSGMYIVEVKAGDLRLLERISVLD